MTAARSGGQGAGAERTRIRGAATGLLLGLIAQFLLGMGVNLFVTLPGSHPGTNAGGYFSGVVAGVSWAIPHGPFLVRVHAALGLLLLLAALGLLARAIQARRGSLIALAAVGAFGLLGSGFNGASFLNYGHDFSSMLMSAGFAIATGCYVLVLVV
ncbi:MAG: hypothetical protein ACREPI_04755 [Candidatus Dormibacterales bacterium]